MGRCQPEEWRVTEEEEDDDELATAIAWRDWLWFAATPEGPDREFRERWANSLDERIPDAPDAPYAPEAPEAPEAPYAPEAPDVEEEEEEEEPEFRVTLTSTDSRRRRFDFLPAKDPEEIFAMALQKALSADSIAGFRGGTIGINGADNSVGTIEWV